MLNFKEPNRTFHSSKYAQDSQKKKRLVNVYILVFEFQLNNEVLIFN